MSHSGHKDFEIRFEERDGYFYAFVSGEKDSLATSKEYWRCAIEECKNRGFNNLLVEENFPNQLSTADMFALTSSIPQIGVSGMKIAFVDQKSEDNELNVFGEMVAINRGVDGRVFLKVEDAEAWLKS